MSDYLYATYEQDCSIDRKICRNKLDSNIDDEIKKVGHFLLLRRFLGSLTGSMT